MKRSATLEINPDASAESLAFGSVGEAERRTPAGWTVEDLTYDVRLASDMDLSLYYDPDRLKGRAWVDIEWVSRKSWRGAPPPELIATVEAANPGACNAETSEGWCGNAGKYADGRCRWHSASNAAKQLPADRARAKRITNSGWEGSAVRPVHAAEVLDGLTVRQFVSLRAVAHELTRR